MKKAILILTIFLGVLTSCSGDDPVTPPSTTLKFAPPTWIQGIWRLKSMSTDLSGFKFTATDFILIATDGTEISQKDLLQTISDNGTAVNIIDEFSDTLYKTTIKHSTTAVYSFSKTSDTTMTWDSTGATYTKE